MPAELISHPTSPPSPLSASSLPSSAAATAPIDWGEQLRVHGRRVVVSLLAMGLPFHDAEEIAQKAWARLIEQHGAGALPVVKLPGLAIAQARFLALSERRAQARNAGAAPLELIVEERGVRGDEQLIDEERVASALRALATCSPTARRVFAMMLDDPPASHAEAAAALGISVQRVRQTLCEVRKILRRSEENAK